MYINCVYCGHQYGRKENTPVSMADILKEHIEKCPKHPLSKCKAENEQLNKTLQNQTDRIAEYIKNEIEYKRKLKTLEE